MASTNKLTDQKVAKAKPKAAPYHLTDGGGLFLLVDTKGGRYWRMAYRYAGKQKTLGVGIYPAVTLAAARAKRDEARAQLAAGTDPSQAKQAAKREAIHAAANSFEAVAREWWSRKHAADVVKTHADRNLRRLEQHLFPAIGRLPIGDVTAGDLLAALQRIEDRGSVETARRVRTLAGQVFRYAIPSGRAARDVAADLRDALQTPTVKHHAAIIDPAEVGALLRAIDGYQGQGIVVGAALRLAPLLFVRPGELRQAEWAAFRLEDGEWDYRPSKGGLPMVFPLPRQAVAILRELHAYTGTGRYLFPSARSNNGNPATARPISDMTLNAALDRMGYREQMRTHGFRATARTLLAERLEFPPEVIEMQLAHAVKDANGRAYNRTTYLEQRRAMMQAWADYLDTLKTGESATRAANVVAFKGGK